MPVNTHLLYKKAQYGYGSAQKKDYIPRLFWLNLDWTLQQVHQHIITQFCHLEDVAAGAEATYYQDTFKELYDYI